MECLCPGMCTGTAEWVQRKKLEMMDPESRERQVFAIIAIVIVIVFAIIAIVIVFAICAIVFVIVFAIIIIVIVKMRVRLNILFYLQRIV